jgi:hypothetical protein
MWGALAAAASTTPAQLSRDNEEIFELDGLVYRTYFVEGETHGEPSKRYFINNVVDDRIQTRTSQMNKAGWGFYSFKTGATEGECMTSGCACWDCVTMPTMSPEDFKDYWDNWRKARDLYLADYEKQFGNKDWKWDNEYKF